MTTVRPDVARARRTNRFGHRGAECRGSQVDGAAVGQPGCQPVGQPALVLGTLGCGAVERRQRRRSLADGATVNTLELSLLLEQAEIAPDRLRSNL